jgi:hypothetical protein
MSNAAISRILNKENVAKLIAIDQSETNHSALMRKSSREGKYRNIEYALFAWFRNMEFKKATLTDDVIQTKAKQIADDMGISTFKCSDLIIGSSISRGDVTSIRKFFMGKVDLQIPFKLSFLVKCFPRSGVQHKNIFNMDETGLNYRGIPTRTLASQVRNGLNSPMEVKTTTIRNC